MNEKLRPKMKIADKYLDLKTADPGMIVEYLEEQIKLREAPLDEKLKKQLLR